MPLFRRTLRLEPLESRRAPATLGADGKSVTFLDADGDTVTVVFNKPVLTAANKDLVFHFDVGTVDGSNAVPQALRADDDSQQEWKQGKGGRDFEAESVALSQ